MPEHTLIINDCGKEFKFSLLGKVECGCKNYQFRQPAQYYCTSCRQYVRINICFTNKGDYTKVCAKIVIRTQSSMDTKWTLFITKDMLPNQEHKQIINTSVEYHPDIKNEYFSFDCEIDVFCNNHNLPNEKHSLRLPGILEILTK